MTDLPPPPGPGSRPPSAAASVERERDELQSRLDAVEQALRALVAGEIDTVQSQTGSPVLLHAAQEALRQSEHLLRGIFNGARDAMLLLDDARTCVDANPAACRLLGRTREHILGRSLAEFMEPGFDLPAAWTDFVERGTSNRAFCVIHADGTLRDVESSSTASIRPGLHLAVLRDLTAQRRQEIRFTAMIERIRDGISLLSADWRTVYQSPSTERLFGFTAEEAKQRGWRDYVVEEDRPHVAEAGQKLLAHPLATVDLEFRLHAKDGCVRWVELSATNHLHDPAITALVCTFRDITARKDEQERIRLLAVIVESSAEAMGSVDLDGRLVNWNRAAAQLFGWEASEVIGQLVSVIIPPEIEASERAILERVKLGESFEHFETKRRRKDGTIIDVVQSISPVRDEHGKVVGAAKITRDLTDRRKAQASLAARDAAEAANRAKSTFLANMSHEIRTPMNAILGYAQLMDRDETLPPKHRKAVGTILASGEHLLGLINDVLELSKIEAGHHALALTDVDLHALLDEVLRMFDLRAAAKSLGVELSRGPNLPRYVVTDEGKLRQILVNLIGNAVKFTERGGIVVRALLRSDHSGTPRLVVEVEDSGPGLDDGELSRLFQPFFQARAGIEARGGTGLGLALSLELARAFGGSIAVESRLKRGSCFRLDVPCREGSAPKGAPPGDSGRPLGLVDPAASPKILVADDDPGQTWVVELLTAVGFQVRHVLNGAEAVDAFDAWAPDMILMDMNMPVLDGYAATRRIRERQASRPVVIVIVTASGFEENRAEAYGAGADGWLRKPLRDDALLGDIGGRLGVQYRHGGPPRGERPSTLPPRDLSVLAAALPIELVATLRAAIQAADFEEAQRVIDRIPREHGAAAEALREQLDRFGYDALLRALAETRSSAPTS